MLVGAGRDLRRMRHRHHLHLAGQPRQPRADGIGHRAADAGIDFVEHQRRRRAPVRQHDLQRQQEPRQLAAGGDLHQRPRPWCRDWSAPRTRRDRSLAGPAISRSDSICVMNFARSSFSGASSALTALLSFSADFVARRGELWRRPRHSACRLRPRPLPASSTARRRRRSAPRRRRISRPAPRGRRPASNICARRRAARTAAPRCAPARRDRNRPRSAPRSRCWSASSSALMAASIAFTAGSTSAGELPARRSSRRTAADSAGTGE